MHTTLTRKDLAPSLESLRPYGAHDSDCPALSAAACNCPTRFVKRHPIATVGPLIAERWEAIARNLAAVLEATAISLELEGGHEAMARDLRQVFQRQCAAHGLTP